MRVIDRLLRLRQPGVFHDFSWPADLLNFGRYNLIYGWNGSGKTTISRVFRDLELRNAPASGDVTFSIAGNKVSGSDFSDARLPVRVFNRDFIDDSVFPAEGDIGPILVLGKENVEKQKDVARLKKTLAKEQVKLESSRQKKSDASSALDGFRREEARVIKVELRSSGPNPYSEYNKGDFTQRAEKMISTDDKDAHALDDILLAQLRGSPKSKLQPLTYRLPDLKALEKSAAGLLSTTVVSAAIRSLKDDAGLSTWVHEGLGLHQDRGGAKCLFCDQPLPHERLAALEAHFSSEYDDLLRKVDDEIATIQVTIKAATDLAVPKAAEFHDDLASEFDSAATALCGERGSAKRALEALAKVLQDKKAQVFERIVLEAIVSDLNSAAVGNLNGVIGKHNRACVDFHSRIESARRQLEAGSVAANLDEFVKLKGDVRAAEGEVEKTKKETRRLTGEIRTLERELVEHVRPAEELNEDLRSYLGHGELRLEVKDTGYAIMRHDVPAVSLSEGETTAIALLYFLKSLQDRRFDLRNGVVVLDDPVSSLDANALFLAFGFIRERTADAGQLFVFTHNFTFFRQVRNWFHHLKGQNKKDASRRPARFYMLDCVRDGGQRCSSIVPLDPLLEQYESEYHYLFACIYRRASAAESGTLEDNYVFPNMARRLLEAFLAFRQPDKSGELWKKVARAEFDEAKKSRILRFLNTHSHGEAVGEPEHDPSLLGEAKSVLEDLMDFIKDQDRDHFAAMVKLVDPPAEEGNEA